MTDYMPCPHCSGTGLITFTALDAEQRESGQRERQAERGLAIAAMVHEQQAEKDAERQRERGELKDARLDDRARLRASEQEMARLRERLDAMERA
jgi:hypothetical protein